MKPAQEWRVHLGAHKTATTHLQVHLAEIAADVNGPDLRIVPKSVSAPAGRCASGRGRGTRIARWRETTQMKITHIPKLESASGDTHTAILSEEDLLGWTQDLLEAQVYPNLSGLDLLQRLTRRSALKVYLSVRDYAAQLPAAYFETMKVFTDADQRLARGAAAVLERRSGWVDLVDRIQARLPKAQIHIWTQEDYGRDARPIIERFLGRSVPVLPRVDRPRQTVWPNAHAAPEIARIDPTLPIPERMARVDAICARHPRHEGPEWQVLDRDTQAALSAQYERDLAALRARYTDIGLTADAPQTRLTGKDAP